ncbi:MAG: HypC/HybG/HupF family hydrogenase formation chaperone [Pseudomonadota bacterium]
MVHAVNLAYVPEAVLGDQVLVHVGVAIAVIDAAAAARTLGYLEQLETTGIED